MTLTEAGSQKNGHPANVNQNEHETPLGNASVNASANANDGTHAGVNVSGARLSRLVNVNGQHNRPANGVQNANVRMGVIS